MKDNQEWIETLENPEAFIGYSQTTDDVCEN